MATFADTDIRTAAKEFAIALKAQGIGGMGTGGMRESSSKDTQKDEKAATEENIRAVRESSEGLDKFKKATKSAGESLKEHFGHLASSVTGLVDRFINSKPVTLAADDITSSLAQGVEAGTLWNRQLDIMTKGLGISVTELNKLDKESRQAQMAMGGYSEWVEELGNESRTLYMRFGDFGESNKFATMALERMVHSGITPTLENLKEAGDITGRYGQSLYTTMDNLQKLGVTYQESSEVLKDLTEDEHVRAKLRAADTEEEREQIIRAKMARFEEFKAMGMTTEQAKNAAKALDEVGGRKALDRFKQAAKAQAALSAMGIEGSGRAAEIIRKGQRATADEQAELAKIMGTAKDRLDEAAMGTFGEEVTMQALYDKGLAPLNVNLENFSTKLDQNAAVTDEKLGELTSVTKEGNAYEQTMAQWAGINRDLAKNALQNSALVNMSIGVLDKIFGAITSLGPMILGGLGLKGALGVLKGGLGKGLGAIRGGLGKLQGGLSRTFRSGFRGLSNTFSGQSRMLNNTMKGGFKGMGGMFKGAFKGVGGVLKGAARFLGPAGAVVGAGMAGWEVGSMIYEGVKDNKIFKGAADSIFGLVDKGLSLFSQEARDRQAIKERLEKTKDQDEADKRMAQAQEKAAEQQEKAMQEAQKQAERAAENVKETKRNTEVATKALDINKSQKDIMQEIRDGIMSINEAVGGEPIDIEWRAPATTGF